MFRRKWLEFLRHAIIKDGFTQDCLVDIRYGIGQNSWPFVWHRSGLIVDVQPVLGLLFASLMFFNVMNRGASRGWRYMVFTPRQVKSGRAIQLIRDFFDREEHRGKVAGGKRV
jgi:hypothetical protein